MGEWQTLLGHAKQLLARRGWHKVLGDHRHLVDFTEAELSWLTDYWLQLPQPRRVLIGAVLVPAAVYAGLAPEMRAEQAQVGAMTYRLFDDPAAAEAWLAEAS
jgi:hypothetical protein